MHEDSRTTPPIDLTRREFTAAATATTLAAGFALAVQPVSAETITTDTKGLEAGEVSVPTPEGKPIPAYRAMPAEGGPFPVVLVVQEIFGVHEHIKDICRRLAKLGYFAIAPEMYYRQGDVSKLTNIPDIIPIVAKVPDSQVLSDLDAAVAYAKSTGKADTSRLAITGFCWGGRIVWLYSAHNPDLKAGVAWYGRLIAQPGQENPLQPKYPIDVIGSLHAPVLGLYGEADQGIPVASVEKMRAALKEANKPAEIVLYPNTPHAFYADYRPSYRKEPAEDGWKRMLAWFKKYGVA
jgi:carboxymethylenebutenolidase